MTTNIYTAKLTDNTDINDKCQRLDVPGPYGELFVVGVSWYVVDTCTRYVLTCYRDELWAGVVVWPSASTNHESGQKCINQDPHSQSQP